MRLLPLAAVLMLCAALPAAAATACPQHYAGGQAPVIVKASLQPRTQAVCFQAFAVVHSGVSRTPLWSAEHLLRAEVEAAADLVRKNSFHPEPRLLPQDRAELADYARSGMDRGHMTPNGDMADRASQGESFSLANIVPQYHTPNAGVWAGIESATRKLAQQDSELYVITGPAFVGSQIASLKDRVLVPTHIWKVIYSPRQQAAGAYLITNEADTSTYSVMTVANLEELIGLRLLPGVPQRVRDNGMVLPKPTRPGSGKRRKGEPAREIEYNLSDYARQAIEAVLKRFK